MTTETQTLRRANLSIDEGVAHFQMRDTASRNAFTQELKDDYADLITLIRKRPDIRALLISGSSGAFCSGGDLKSLAADNAVPMARRCATSRRSGRACATAISGSRACSISRCRWWPRSMARPSAPGSRWRWPPTSSSPRRDRASAWPSTASAPSRSGGAVHAAPHDRPAPREGNHDERARGQCAPEALSLGIVHSLHEHDALMDVAMGMARRFTQGSAEALALTKLYCEPVTWNPTTRRWRAWKAWASRSA
jgi:hypothetical protein